MARSATDSGASTGARCPTPGRTARWPSWAAAKRARVSSGVSGSSRAKIDVWHARVERERPAEARAQVCDGVRGEWGDACRARARDRAATSSPRSRTTCYHPPYDFERLVRDRNTSMGDTAATYPRCENTRERPARARKPPSAHGPGVGSMAFPRPSNYFCETLCMRLISFSPLPNIRPRRSGRPRYRPCPSSAPTSTTRTANEIERMHKVSPK